VSTAPVSCTRIATVRVDGLRNLVDVEAVLGPTFNVFTGRNGAGKTSILEAVHLLAHGRSFRGGSNEALIQQGREHFSVFGDAHRVNGSDSGCDRLGLSYGGDGWSLRRNGQAVGSLSEFVRTLGVVTLDPNSHELIVGPSEARRRFLDWLLFHVEPGFLEAWRRYTRALRQRNAALRRGNCRDPELASWEAELATSGEAIQGQRHALIQELEPLLRPLVATVAPGLDVSGLRVRTGWPAGMALHEALREGRAADRERGFTQRGPHRADWRLSLAAGLDHAQLSRGQAKLAAFVCLLAQAQLYCKRSGAWPIISVDDLAAELDSAHQGLLLTWLAETRAQVLVTGTEPLAVQTESRLFHVEQGRLRQLV
jgi:DNA replication and repair protein RecF